MFETAGVLCFFVVIAFGVSLYCERKNAQAIKVAQSIALWGAAEFVSFDLNQAHVSENLRIDRENMWVATFKRCDNSEKVLRLKYSFRHCDIQLLKRLNVGDKVRFMYFNNPVWGKKFRHTDPSPYLQILPITV